MSHALGTCHSWKDSGTLGGSHGRGRPGKTSSAHAFRLRPRFVASLSRCCRCAGPALTGIVRRHKYAFIRTSIDLPGPLLREAKAVAALCGQSLKEVVVTALRHELRDGRATPGRRKGRKAAFPKLACKGDFVIQPTKEQLDDVV